MDHHIAVIQLNNTEKLILCISLARSGPDTGQQMPCGIVAYTQSAAQLNGGDTSLVGGAQVDRPEPDGQRQMGAVHDSSSGNRGLSAAGAALKEVPAPNG